MWARWETGLGMKSAVGEEEEEQHTWLFLAWPDTMNSKNANVDKCDRDMNSVSRELTGRASTCVREWGKSLVIQQALTTC